MLGHCPEFKANQQGCRTLRLVLLVAGGKWKNAKSAGQLYSTVIMTTLLVVGEFLWRPRLERQGGAQLSLPQIEMEDEEDWNSDESV